MLDGIWQQDCFALRMPMPEVLEDDPAERSDHALWLAMGVALGLHAVCFAGLWHWPPPLAWSEATAPTVLTVTMAPSVPQQLHTVPPSSAAAPVPSAPSYKAPIPATAPHAVPATHRVHTTRARPRRQQATSAAVVAQPAMSASVATIGAAAIVGPPATDKVPACVTRTEPVYPSAARRRGQQGVVMVTVEVDADGATLRVSLQHSSGYAVLDTAALNAVRHWRFTPAHRAGRAVRAAVQVPIRFRLTGGGDDEV